MKTIALFFSSFIAFAVACGGGEPPKTVEPKFAEVAAIHKAKCGACHKRVEPGLRTRDHLETALKPHRKRVPMTEENWSLLIDYLSADGKGATPTGDPSNPAPG